MRAVIVAAESFDPAAALALRIAAMTGARRAELAALRWTDVDDDGMLTIDSAIEVIRHEPAPMEVRDAPTKTANARRLTLDPTTHAAIWKLRRECSVLRDHSCLSEAPPGHFQLGRPDAEG